MTTGRRTEMLAVFVQVIWRRRLSLFWWSLGVLAMDGLLGVAYPTVRDNSELDKTFAGLPPSVQAVLGLQGAAHITSPIGYLNSQYYANLLPIILLVFAIGLAAWAIGGDEAAGTLELLLANPVSRLRVAMERALAVISLLGVLTAIAALGLIALAPPTGLNHGLSSDKIVEASIATGLLVLVYASLAFAVGAATGVRSLAVSISASVAVALFAIEGVAAQVKTLQPVQLISPWHWFFHSDPLQNGLSLEAWLPPLVTSVVLIAAGALLFGRRDLR
jgi:ABC-2 type transport system permease protein